VRHPECWRFLFPLPDDREEFTQEELREKAIHFIGDIKNVEVLGSNIYSVHHRVAQTWRKGRCFLMGDAAHLITPMWALGLNTGALDASNLPWRLAWVMRDWAQDALLDGYEREQKPVAVNGSGELAEAARRHMNADGEQVSAMTDNDWGNAYTRTMLAVRLDVNGTGDWSMVKTSSGPPPVEEGDRAPDGLVHDASGREIRLHDLFGSSFVALYFTDVRRGPEIPKIISPGLKHFAVSRWDAPLDSGIRDRSLFDSGNSLLKRYQCPPDSLVLVRPDDHIAAICPMAPGKAEALYCEITGQDLPKAETS
jgi:3-(3-hydroxy-phenyl)propionate hydroxylase